MNFGECPYEDCNDLLMLKVPERTPAFALVECEGCKRSVWYRFSRIDPEAWTVLDFEKEHEIDEATRTIKKRNAAGL